MRAPEANDDAFTSHISSPAVVVPAYPSSFVLRIVKRRQKHSVCYIRTRTSFSQPPTNSPILYSISKSAGSCRSPVHIVSVVPSNRLPRTSFTFPLLHVGKRCMKPGLCLQKATRPPRIALAGQRLTRSRAGVVVAEFEAGRFYHLCRPVGAH